MKRILNIVLFLAVCVTMSGQQYQMNLIRNAINNWQSLRGCALGETQGNVAWYGSNGYQYQGLNNNIAGIISRINNDHQRIDYVSIADNGNYAIIHNNGNNWSALGPQEFYNNLNEIVNREGIRSASINSANQYFIVGKSGSIRTNNQQWLDFYNSEKNRMGNIKTAWCHTNGIVICFERGYNFYGIIPMNVKQELDKLDWVPDFIQFSQSGNYVAAQESGRSVYRLNDYAANERTNTYYNYNNSNASPAAPIYYPTPNVPTTNPCGVCNSTGKCLKCGGSGISPNHAPGIIAKCGYCGGSGRCATCGGRGYN